MRKLKDNDNTGRCLGVLGGAMIGLLDWSKYPEGLPVHSDSSRLLESDIYILSNKENINKD